MGLNQHKLGSLLTDGKKKIYILSDQDNRDRDSNIAQNPVENGSTISDHVALNSDTGQIQGIMLGDGNKNKDAQDYLATIEKWQNNGTKLKYYGRYFLYPILIQGNEHYFDSAKNAVHVTLTWTVLHLVAAPKQSARSVKKAVKPKKRTSSGTYVTVRSGDTYWGWMMKYGTSIAQLEAWNHWPARLFPTGARARVK